ncbi:MAG: glycine--tRNA ligase subunit beta [Candidatus Schekmanbacteria bacterium RIFCSPHIGHO2_02_FULL_38_11]|uniref:Glycine--tRNA ligase beta subunit n=1 Tax=Candidatus Schekmanbacteria bacterium RIFCSPLOWO2_12_FULL_38_15 TaxID=1817883 RepID=A0A1F7SFL3_9BACT|nr:MAG: glycine--tRNA ligase subunit beta [Candidatus Schekmanbacteria bacterium GWA2_38_9]OGL48592.1 MAG: glycine--tRNA ligase subunit beta [Candidatus Schekmanbacteria bacterium RIFCSPLOWO2_02_FULL_38_14]OGL50138.1 MAG: glycine--tRNA ligase subunit beta [Candidatus Schekmanbacteria bacterium RIFCSPHIGHO2_02_FULL_38_11]OGL52572.1 MAG: glycine--tRNA ligase subunit beta [Candidatus Schekmanbacteria bacterium RIFCSPLOWO2_12_FULL_38_15]
MTKELLIEIGTEDIPAKFFPEALENLKSVAEKNLRAERLKFKETIAFGTMRRIVLLVKGLEEKQEDLVEEVIGPKAEASFDSGGNPTQAAAGFAKAHSVDISSLFIKETKKGKSVCARKKLSGKNTKEILPEIILKIISELSFPKSMRWGNLDFRFARPVHWLLVLYNGEVIKLKVGDVESSNISFGHRFLSPDTFEVRDFKDYRKKCKANFVIVDPLERKTVIESGIKNAASSKNGSVSDCSALLETVNFMAEYPTAFVGSFSERFLSIPKEVLINTMKKQQMYFPLFNSQNNLMNYFIGVADTENKDLSIIIKGNERVLRARFSDAEFFFKEDQKIKLESRVDALKGIIFLEKLGTVYDKVVRIGKLAAFLNRKVLRSGKNEALNLDEGIVQRSAMLCKTDLLTEMVKEFPELQGIMGREYALLQKENENIAASIYEHYLPRFAEDETPLTDYGTLLSLADKFDTISGCFSISLVPTGSEDPLGLRRSTIGIINILINREYKLSLKETISESLKLYGVEKNREGLQSNVLSFFTARFKNILISQGYESDVIDAVFSQNFDDLLDSKNRIDAISRMKKEEGFNSLTTTFKRAIRILPGNEKNDVRESLLRENAERDLYTVFKSIQAESRTLLDNGDYYAALKKISKIKDQVDKFFDDVMVMVDDAELKKNRLSLLNNVIGLFSRIADFSRISEG